MSSTVYEQQADGRENLCCKFFQENQFWKKRSNFAQTLKLLSDPHLQKFCQNLFVSYRPSVS